jgi:hypothetical protein
MVKKQQRSGEQVNFLDLAVDVQRTHEYPIPPHSKINLCKSCNAQIVWTQTPAGANVPLALSTIRHQGGTDYAQSHYLDCPHASAWGKRKQEQQQTLEDLAEAAPEIGRLYSELVGSMTDEQKQRLAAAQQRRGKEQE